MRAGGLLADAVRQRPINCWLLIIPSPEGGHEGRGVGIERQRAVLALEELRLRFRQRRRRAQTQRRMHHALEALAAAVGEAARVVRHERLPHALVPNGLPRPDGSVLRRGDRLQDAVGGARGCGLGAHDVPRIELLVLGVAVQRELHLVREPQGEALLHLAEVEKHAALALAALAAFLLLTALIIPALLGLQAGLLGAWGGIGWGGILVVSLGLGARLPGVICFRWLRRRAVLRRRPLPALLRCGGFLFSRTIGGLSSQLLTTCIISGLLHAGRLGGIRAAGHGGEARRCRDIGLSAFLLSLLVRLGKIDRSGLVLDEAKGGAEGGHAARVTHQRHLHSAPRAALTGSALGADGVALGAQVDGGFEHHWVADLGRDANHIWQVEGHALRGRGAGVGVLDDAHHHAADALAVAALGHGAAQLALLQLLEHHRAGRRGRDVRRVELAGLAVAREAELNLCAVGDRLWGQALLETAEVEEGVQRAGAALDEAKVGLEHVDGAVLHALRRSAQQPDGRRGVVACCQVDARLELHLVVRLQRLVVLDGAGIHRAGGVAARLLAQLRVGKEQHATAGLACQDVDGPLHCLR
mmetsp:Transcript_39151/g.99208  ORF Transcript_39151/g.99208 Transcript_39151/m.99208 type:complete len:585 (-) Transcript_39151:956-2710(-)